MRSIHRYLLTVLLLALVAGSALTAVLVYRNATVEINELYDRNMQQVAMLLQNQLEGGELHPHNPLRKTPTKMVGEENMLIQLWRGPSLIYSSHPAISMPLQDKRGHFATLFQYKKWRVYHSDLPDISIQLAQPYVVRDLFIREMAREMLYPMLAQIPLIGLFIWLAVGRSLAPLSGISRAIHERSAASLEPLDVAHIPNEVRPLVDELNALLKRLDMALGVQLQFTMDAAHELRTPLAALKLQLGNLERAKDAGEQATSLAKLHSGIDRASHVVQQLLVLARLQPDSAARQDTSVDVLRVLRMSIETHAEIAYARRIDLGCTRSEPVMVPGNPDGVRIVIDNLLDNALRYTPKGGKVDVSVYEDGGAAVIEVKDTGIGIAESERERVFERFYRIIGTKANGTGLGLAIVQHIVRDHGGSIRISEGIEGRGTGFTVRLPGAKSSL